MAAAFKCALIGASGGRAKGHVEAYSHVRHGTLTAVAARTAAPRDVLANAHGIPGRYDDYREMVAAERPDLVHVNTPPSARLSILAELERAQVPAALVEKPVAIDGPDHAALVRFATGCRMRVAVNHQLHYHPARQRLQRLVAGDELGALRLIDASCGMNAAYQGTHSVQAIMALAGTAGPSAIFAQASGARGLEANPRQHLAPDDLLAQLDFDSGLRALLRCGTGAPRLRGTSGAAPAADWAHKRVTVYGARGAATWTMWGWETSIDGAVERGSHDYWAEDGPAQAALVDSLLGWLRAGGGHPLQLAAALDQFALVLAAYRSVVDARVLSLPAPVTAPVLDELRAHLTAPASARG